MLQPCVHATAVKAIAHQHLQAILDECIHHQGEQVQPDDDDDMVPDLDQQLYQASPEAGAGKVTAIVKSCASSAPHIPKI